MLRLSRVALRVATGATLAATAVSLALAPVAGASGSSQAAAQKVYVAGETCTGHSYKPTKIVLACADANLYVTSLKYSSYGGQSASATGTIHVNDCTPDCAGGHFHAYPGSSIRLFDIVQCSDGRSYYGEAKYHFKHGKGTAAIEPFRLHCKAS